MERKVLSVSLPAYPPCKGVLAWRGGERIRRAVCAAGLPEDVMLGAPRVIICGRGRMMMENHQGIVEYGPEKLRVQTAQGIVSVEGENLTLASLGEEDLMVTGEIRRVEM